MKDLGYKINDGGLKVPVRRFSAAADEQSRNLGDSPPWIRLSLF